MKYPTKTPWGYADQIKEICEGVAIINTPSHGGIAVHESIPLTHAARRRAIKSTTVPSGDTWYFFEEDCDWAIAVYEIPAVRELSWPEEYSGTLVAWNADYLMEVGVDPTLLDGGKYLKSYIYWLERKIGTLMRQTRSPDLVVSRAQVENDFVSVTTADGKNYLFKKGMHNEANRLRTIQAEAVSS